MLKPLSLSLPLSLLNRQGYHYFSASVHLGEASASGLFLSHTHFSKSKTGLTPVIKHACTLFGEADTKQAVPHKLYMCGCHASVFGKNFKYVAFAADFTREGEGRSQFLVPLYIKCFNYYTLN